MWKKNLHLKLFLYSQLHRRQHSLSVIVKAHLFQVTVNGRLLFFLPNHKNSTVFSRKHNLRLLEHLLEKSSHVISLAKNDLVSHRGILFGKIMMYFINRCEVFLYDSATIYGSFCI